MNSIIPRREYPRPQFVRDSWLNLNGSWSFEFDPGCSGVARGRHRAAGFDRQITVPFCSESSLSGIGHTDFIDQMFYHRKLNIPADWEDRRILLHFSGVDYECEAFIDGRSAGRHFGGSVSFFFDLSDLVRAGASHDLVLRVRDDIRSGVQPGGKQSSAFASAGCRYSRVTGIWQTVWLEALAFDGLKSCRITPDLDNARLLFTPLFFNQASGRKLAIQVSADGRPAGRSEVSAASGVPVPVELDIIRPWSPEDPFIYDIEYLVSDAGGNLVDRVTGYAGLRKIHLENGKFQLNNRPIFLRLVLDQGFYQDGIWTAPSDDALRRDIELAQQAGFNGARLHQKVFEERFHYWADKLGYLTWGESASWGLYFCRYNSAEKPAAVYWEGVFNFLHEWKEVVERDYSHPSIIAWSPLNETIPGADFDLYRKTLAEIYDCTKMLDPTRPCNEASGFVHVKTDLWTVHLYRKDGTDLQDALKPAGGGVFKHAKGDFRQHDPEGEGYSGQPYLNAEFGGFMYIPPERRKFAANTWGYHGLELRDGDELCAKITEQIEVMNQMPELAGFCYTQLTDVEQEQNGLYNYDRTPKAAPEKLRAVFGK